MLSSRLNSLTGLLIFVVYYGSFLGLLTFIYPTFWVWLHDSPEIPRNIVSDEAVIGTHMTDYFLHKAREHLFRDCDRDWLREGKPPIFVTGPPRSGTTVVGIILSLGAYSTYIHEPFNPEYKLNPCQEERSSQMTSGITRPPIASETSQWLDSLIYGKCRKEICAERLIIKDPVGLYLSQYLFDKYNARLIVKLRHPGAIYVSRKKMGYGTRDLILSNLVDELQYVSMLQQIFGHNSYWMWIKHEDFCLTPIPVIERMYEFCLMPFTPEIRADVETLINPKNPDLASDWNAIFLNPKDQLLKWKGEILPEEANKIKIATRFFWEGLYSEDSWNLLTTDI